VELLEAEGEGEIVHVVREVPEPPRRVERFALGVAKAAQVGGDTPVA
jgi:hypothetical protein